MSVCTILSYTRQYFMDFLEILLIMNLLVYINFGSLIVYVKVVGNIPQDLATS